MSQPEASAAAAENAMSPRATLETPNMSYAETVQDVITIDEEGWVKITIDNKIYTNWNVEELHTFKDYTNWKVEELGYTFKDTFRGLGIGRSYEFVLSCDETDTLQHECMLSILVAWLESEFASVALVLTNVPLALLVRATKRVPRWHEAVSTLNTLVLRVEESADQVLISDEFDLLGKIVQQASDLQGLCIEVNTSTDDEVARFIHLGENSFSRLKVCAFENLVVEASELRSLIESNSSHLEYLRLDNVELRNGDWLALLKSIGECGLPECEVYFGSLYDDHYSWHISYKNLLEGWTEQEPNIRKLERWLRHGGEFPFDDHKVLNNKDDRSIDWEVYVRNDE